jgi:hypothetical protein
MDSAPTTSDQDEKPRGVNSVRLLLQFLGVSQAKNQLKRCGCRPCGGITCN